MEVSEQVATTERPVVDEERVQRAIERAKETAQVAGLRDALVLEFDIEAIEMTEVRLERDGLELEFDLYDLYGLDGSLKKSSKLGDADKAYLPLLVISYAGKQRTFTPGVFTSEAEARDALPDDAATREEMPFRFTSKSSEKLRYGLLTSSRRYIPDAVEPWFNNAWVVMGLMLALPLALLAVSLGATIVVFTAIFVGVMAIEHVEEWATAIDGIDLDEVYQQASGEREFDVTTCEFHSTADALTIRSPDHDAEWTFKKNAMGELSPEGKQALDAVSVEGRECIACISRSRIDEVNELESDCGKWKLEQT